MDDNIVNDDCKLHINLLPVSESYPSKGNKNLQMVSQEKCCCTSTLHCSGRSQGVQKTGACKGYGAPPVGHSP